MVENQPFDIMQGYRDMLANWEKMANDFGGQVLAREEAAQAMHGFNTAKMAVQTQLKDAMLKSLDAVQIPSKADIEALGTRLGAMEAAIARIETRLLAMAPDAAPAGPKRTRRPDSNR